MATRLPKLRSPHKEAAETDGLGGFEMLNHQPFRQ